MKTFKVGTKVRAVVDLDPTGANVKVGETGVVVEERDGEYGPLVRWGKRHCNVRDWALEDA